MGKNIDTLAIITILSACLIPLNGCSKTKEQFDFSKKAPDEFAVITRAPLEMPNNLESLPLPRPGATRPQETTSKTEAKQALFGKTPVAQEIPNMTEGESILLQKTGTADNNIRDVIDTETKEVIKENTSTFNKILGKAGKKVDAPATVVDPVKETERIIENRKTGKPVTEGETPSLEQ